LNEKVNKILQENLHEYDLACELSQLNLDLIKELSKLEPFGSGNPRPRFLIRNLNKIKANFVGKEQEHLSIIFSNQGLTGFNNQISAILFKANISKLTPTITQLKTSQTIDIIGTIDINNWLGIEKLQIQIEDIIL
jgi:single-stranded-DNA-specific exonuclease